MEIPVGYEEEPFQDQAFFVPETREEQALVDITNLDESRISARRDTKEEEEKRIRESEEVNTHCQ